MSEKNDAPVANTAPASERLVWLDMEMSGLKPDSDRILEIALIVTDANLNAIATAPVWVVQWH